MNIICLRLFFGSLLLINSIFFLPYETLSRWSMATLGVGVYTSTDVTLIAMGLTLLMMGTLAAGALIWELFLKPTIAYVASRG